MNIVKANKFQINVVNFTRWFFKIFRFRGKYRIAKIIVYLFFPKDKILIPHKNGLLMTFNLQNPHEISMLFDLFAKELSNVLSSVLRPNDIFIDCGANIGYFTFMAAALTNGKNGKVVAVEPNPYCENRLMESKKLGEYHNVDIYGLAISNCEGQLDFNISVDPMFSSISDLNLLKFTETSETISVPVIKADTLIKDLLNNKNDSIRLMKIDVEGAELDVLEGMSDALSNSKVQYIFIEIHPQQLAIQGKDFNDVIELIEKSGFKKIEKYGDWSYLYKCS